MHWSIALLVGTILAALQVEVTSPPTRILWIDGTANLAILNSPDSIRATLDKAVAAGFDTVVIDVRPLSGEVLYDSKYAPRLRSWKGSDVRDDRDILRMVVESGHGRGLKVLASVNVFSIGHKLYERGLAYGDKGTKSGAMLSQLPPEAVALTLARSLTVSDKQLKISGVNSRPGSGACSLITRGFGPAYPLGQDEVAAEFELDALPAALNREPNPILAKVRKVIDAALWPEASLETPENCFLVVGRGKAAGWLRDNLRLDQRVRLVGSYRRMLASAASGEKLAVFTNPADPAARRYALTLLKEIIQRYPVDGILLDRIRYSSPNTDFSDLSRSLYEEFVGYPVQRFPDDVATIPILPTDSSSEPSFSGMWRQFRAEQIRSFVAEARRELKAMRPRMLLGAYVGASYDNYAGYGANWGAAGISPRDSSLPSTYGTTGFAQELDFLVTGCYFARLSGNDTGSASRGSVQEAAARSVEVTQGKTRVIGGINAALFKDNPANLARAIEICLERTSGVMVFDLSHIEKNGWWKNLRAALSAGGG